MFGTLTQGYKDTAIGDTLILASIILSSLPLVAYAYIGGKKGLSCRFFHLYPAIIWLFDRLFTLRQKN